MSSNLRRLRNDLPPVVAVVGPTAVGKSGLALKLAQALGGEIVNGDSRQVYRKMDIGTAKPSRADMSLAPHHLYDILDPDAEFSLTLYHDLAYKALRQIGGRGKVAFLVGGSGQYVWSLLEGWQPPAVAPQPELRRELEAEGADILYGRLEQIDPEAAFSIDPRNLRRVIRAIEVHQVTGKRFSDLTRKSPPEFPFLIIGLTADRAELYRRIDHRVDIMMEQGLLAEVEGLVARGYSLDLPSMSGLGYKQIGEYLKGKATLPEAVQRIKHDTHRYARQQYAWFKLSDERIHWFDISDDFEAKALQLAERFLA